MEKNRESKKHNKKIKKNNNRKKFKYYLELTKDFTITEFKLKYRNNFFGYFWSLITPILMLITLYIIFSIVMKLDVPHYQLFLLLGIIYWNYFSESTNSSFAFIMSKSNLINKQNFPKTIMVISSSLASFITLLLNLIVFFGFMIVLKVPFHWPILYLPVNLIELLLLSIGTSFFLTSYYVKYRDISHIWDFLLLIGFWITPIIYKESIIPPQYRRYYMLNPLARLISNARDITIYNYMTDIKQIIITWIIIGFVFVIGYKIFKKRSKYFAEEL